MPTVGFYSKEQIDTKVGAILPSTAGATAGQVLGLDSNLDPAWINGGGGGGFNPQLVSSTALPIESVGIGSFTGGFESSQRLEVNVYPGNATITIPLDNEQAIKMVDFRNYMSMNVNNGNLYSVYLYSTLKDAIVQNLSSSNWTDILNKLADGTYKITTIMSGSGQTLYLPVSSTQRQLAKMDINVTVNSGNVTYSISNADGYLFSNTSTVVLAGLIPTSITRTS